MFIDKNSPQGSSTPKTKKKECLKEVLLHWSSSIGLENTQANIHQSMVPDAMHPQVLIELMGTIIRPLMIFFESSWWSRVVPEDWKTTNTILVFKMSKRRAQGIAGRQSHLSPWSTLFGRPSLSMWMIGGDQ